MDYGYMKAVCVAAKDCQAPLSSTIQGDEGYIVMRSPSSQITEFQMAFNKQEEVTYNENGPHNRMYYEFVELKNIIETNDKEKMDALLQDTLDVMEVLTEARKKAGVIFPAD